MLSKLKQNCNFSLPSASTVAMLNLNACSILEKTSRIGSSKEIGPLPGRLQHVICREAEEDQRNDLDAHWPSVRFVGDEAHGSDWTFVFRGRPHTSDMQSINSSVGCSTRHSVETVQAWLLYSLSKYATEGIGPFSANT